LRSAANSFCALLIKILPDSGSVAAVTVLAPLDAA
jgi:hypothetical protein